MEVRPRELRVYETPSGNFPFDDWIDGLRDATNSGRIRVRIDRLQMGNLGDCESVGGGVKELRMDFGPGYRVYFAEEGRKIILLLIGGDKSTQTKDIKIAKSYLRQYRKSAL